MFDEVYASPFNNLEVMEIETIHEPTYSYRKSVDSIISVVRFFSYGFACIGFILAIVFIIKSILDKKKLKEEVSEKTIKNIKVTSIILLVVNILSCNLISLILAIIATVFVSKAKKLVVDNYEIAIKKVNTANVLNIVACALMFISPIFTVIITTLMNIIVVNSMMFM